MDETFAGVNMWLNAYEMKNEKGDPIEFHDHLFLFDIYEDQSKNLTVMKGAQVGLSTLEVLKNIHDAKNEKMDIIYTLPTDNDVNLFVGGKVNRIIAANPILLRYTKDKDSVEQKQIGESMMYFRGTWSKKAAIMVTADRVVHDEKDSSKLDVIADFQTRLQHSKFKQTHTFSHPSVPDTGVHTDWLLSDQKHWFNTCPHCKYRQYMSWDMEDPKKMSIDFERKAFVCKRCRKILTDGDRKIGQWIARCPENREWSGYHVNLLMAPWMSAEEIIKKWKDPKITREHFYTKILGLPYADGLSKLLQKHYQQNLTGRAYAPSKDDFVVIGIDTGLRLDYVVGDKHGLFYHADADDYGELDKLMERWPRAVAIIDQGGDLIGSRKFYARWPGRVYLCSLTGDRKTKEMIKWGTGDEDGAVTVDRNRAISMVVGEFRDKRIPLWGTDEDWFDYYLDWKNLSRIKVLDPETNEVKGFKWVRSGRDHRALATVFWRVGISRFATGGIIVQPRQAVAPNSYMINPDGKSVSINPEDLFQNQNVESDWRN